MLKLFVSVMICTAWLATSSVLAQPETEPLAKVQPTSPEAPVIVRAPLNPKEIEKQASGFVTSYAASANDNIDQIARWREPVCVLVLDLPLNDQASKIKARIEGLAQTLGLPAAKPNCKPNVEIAFEDDPQTQMDAVAKRLQYLLGYNHLSMTNELKLVTHPIQAWYVTATKSDSIDATVLGLLAPPPQGPAHVGSSSNTSGLSHVSQSKIDDPNDAPPLGCLDRFTSCYKSSFYNVLIVANNKALVGEKLSTVADDLAMLALSQPQSLDGCYALPSVIDRFAKTPCTGRDLPDGLTSADRAYLTALYSAGGEGKRRFEEVDIASRMGALLIKTNSDAAK